MTREASMQDVMLDLETYGTRPGCVVRSLGAVFFDLKGRVGAEMYRNIDHKSCIDAGLKVEQSTAEWWAKQSEGARNALLVNPQPLKSVVTEFYNWFTAKGGKRVWCQGATFDAPVWEAAALAVDRKVPWSYWGVRDTRTAYDLYNFDPKVLRREGTYHNALDDARHQVSCLQLAVEKHSLQLL